MRIPDEFEYKYGEEDLKEDAYGDADADDESNIDFIMLKD